MCRNVRFWCNARQKFLHCFTVTSHVGMINECQKSNTTLLSVEHLAAKLKFDVFGMRAAYIRVQMYAVGHFWHQSFRESRRPTPVVVFKRRPERETPRSRGV